MAAEHDAPLTATVEQFKRLSGLGRMSIYKLIKTGDLRSVLICGRRLIVMESYRDLIARSGKSVRIRPLKAASSRCLMVDC